MRVGLIPLDERPANTRYPAMVGAICGIEVVLPPRRFLGSFRRPADVEHLAQWLMEESSNLDAVLVSLEMLGYGGLIPSRITDDSADKVISRLGTLRDLRRARPEMTIYGFGVITRIPDIDDATEEPEYWKSYGRKLHRLSQLLDRQTAGHAVDTTLKNLRRELPETVVGDFLARRLRNHTVNLAALELAADDTLDLLVMGSDDTSVWGLNSAERRWFGGWIEHLGLPQKVLQYPGADEIGCTMIARLINRQLGRVPRIETVCAVPGAEHRIPLYEDRPIVETIDHHVEAVGAVSVEADAELCLIVSPPDTGGGDWAIDPPGLPGSESAADNHRIDFLVNAVAEAQERNIPVAVADLTFANGADLALVEHLRERGLLFDLAAYGAWNTAGNTIGTVVAQGCCALSAADEAGHEAHRRFLLHRLLEDWGYQTMVRDEVRCWLKNDTGSSEPIPENLGATVSEIERRLARALTNLPGFASSYRLKPQSVRLPWARTFECDFELESKVTCGEEQT